MILLKILSFLLLLPSFLLFLISLTLYSSHVTYRLSIFLCVSVLSALTAFTFSSYWIGLFVFISTASIWACRMHSLKTNLDAKNGKNLLFLTGRLKKHSKEVSMFCSLPFFILKVIKKIPAINKCNISKNESFDMTLGEFIDLIIQSCKGTLIHINTSQVEINLSIN